MNAQLAGNAVNTTNIQNGAITTMQIAAGAVTNANLTANAVATPNIENGAVTDAKIVSMSGSKVSGGVALATNSYYANELQTSVLTGVDPVVTTFWNVYAAGVAGPGIVPHDLVVSANGAAQMVIRPSGLGVGIGTSSPQASLHVMRSDTDGPILQLERPSNHDATLSIGVTGHS